MVQVTVSRSNNSKSNSLPAGTPIGSVAGGGVLVSNGSGGSSVSYQSVPLPGGKSTSIRHSGGGGSSSSNNVAPASVGGESVLVDVNTGRPIGSTPNPQASSQKAQDQAMSLARQNVNTYNEAIQRDNNYIISNKSFLDTIRDVSTRQQKSIESQKVSNPFSMSPIAVVSKAASLGYQEFSMGFQNIETNIAGLFGYGAKSKTFQNQSQVESGGAILNVKGARIGIPIIALGQTYKNRDITEQGLELQSKFSTSVSNQQSTFQQKYVALIDKKSNQFIGTEKQYQDYQKEYSNLNSTIYSGQAKLESMGLGKTNSSGDFNFNIPTTLNAKITANPLSTKFEKYGSIGADIIEKTAAAVASGYALETLGVVGAVGRGSEYIFSQGGYVAKGAVILGGTALTVAPVAVNSYSGYKDYTAAGASGTLGAISGGVTGLGEVSGFMTGATKGEFLFVPGVKVRDVGMPNELGVSPTKTLSLENPFGKGATPLITKSPEGFSFGYPKELNAKTFGVENIPIGEYGYQASSKTEIGFINKAISSNPLPETQSFDLIAYHGTDTLSSQKILQEGLQPFSETGKTNYPNLLRSGSLKKNDVFVALNQEAAQGYANLGYTKGLEPEVIKVGLYKEQLLDSTFSNLKGGELGIKGGIPSSQIAKLNSEFPTLESTRLSTEQIIFERGLDITEGLSGVKIKDINLLQVEKSSVFENLQTQAGKDVIKNTFTELGMEQKGFKGFMNAVNNKGLERIYGSSTISSEGGFETNINRPGGKYGDFDLNFRDFAMPKAEKLFGKLKAAGEDVKLTGSLIELKNPKTGEYEHAFDFHGADTPDLQMKSVKLGIKGVGTKEFGLDTGSIKGQQLRQSLVDKASATLQLRVNKRGQLYFSPPDYRMKDVADFVSIAEKLNTVKGGNEFGPKIESFKNVLQVAYPEIKFGGESESKLLFGSLGSNKPSPLLSSGVSGISSGFNSRSSKTNFNSKGLGISQKSISSSLSPSYFSAPLSFSPSYSTSKSSSLSPSSYSPSSYSPSSFSPSSLSPSQSGSPSFSPSPYSPSEFSPSPSLSSYSSFSSPRGLGGFDMPSLGGFALPNRKTRGRKTSFNIAPSFTAIIENIKMKNPLKVSRTFGVTPFQTRGLLVGKKSKGSYIQLTDI